jgi:hypothetical protein
VGFLIAQDDEAATRLHELGKRGDVRRGDVMRRRWSNSRSTGYR